MNVVEIVLFDLTGDVRLIAEISRILSVPIAAHLALRTLRLQHLPLAQWDQAIAAAITNNTAAALILTPQEFVPASAGPILTLRKLHLEALVIADCQDPIFVEPLLQTQAADFITTPLKAIELIPRLLRIVSSHLDTAAAAHNIAGDSILRQLLGENEAFLTEIRKIPRLAATGVSVLIRGDTGTGKELAARAVHYLSPRRHRPFVAVNCGAIPIELIENELFGHEAGAYTGAARSRHGVIHEAEGGTLFLDEIDCLPLLSQAKLLRFLQEKEYRPLGSAKTIRAEVRIVCATNTDLDQAVREGRFRQDLFYRLNVGSIRLPALSERPEDIPILARHFLRKYAAVLSRPVREIGHEAMRDLQRRPWPGNVRELEHAVERAVIFSNSPVLTSADFADERPARKPAESLRDAKKQVVRQFERAQIEELLAAHNGNITQAAKAAAKNRRAFWELMRKHGITAARYRTATA